MHNFYIIDSIGLTTCILKLDSLKWIINKCFTCAFIITKFIYAFTIVKHLTSGSMLPLPVYDAS